MFLAIEAPLLSGEPTLQLRANGPTRQPRCWSEFDAVRYNTDQSDGKRTGLHSFLLTFRFGWVSHSLYGAFQYPRVALDSRQEANKSQMASR